MKHVFISSTFKDMQFERDALHTVAAVKINKNLSQYGEEVYFGDLRWGVNTTALDSEDGCRRVLEVCLDEIDDCRPYMIVLVGERYGWIPDGKTIRGAALAKGVEICEDISVTQLEIEYGALLSSDNAGRIFFYFRELDTSGMREEQLADYVSESELHKKKIDELKARISELYPDAVRTYTARFDAAEGRVVGLESFLESVVSDVSGAFLADIEKEESLPWQERALHSAERYYLELSKNYYDAERKPLSVFDGTFASDEPIVKFVKGDSGMGKSAFLAHNYAQMHECRGERALLPFVLGLDKYSTCEADYFKLLLYKLEELCGEEHTETDYGEQSCEKTVFEGILRLSRKAEGKLHSVIDNCSYELQNELSLYLLDRYMLTGAADYFGSSEHSCKSLDFLIAYSADEKDVILPPCFDFSRTYVLGDVAEEDQIPLVKMLLRQKHKELDESVIAAITEKEQATSPFYLKLATDRMLMLDSRDFSEIRAMGDGMSNINRYQISVVESLPDTVPELAAALIRCVASRVGCEFVMRLIGVLTYGGVRMSESFIEGVFSTRSWGYSSLDFALATRSLSAVINYNPKDKSYAIVNTDAISAIEQMLDEGGYLYVASELFAHAVQTGAHRDVLFRAAAYSGADNLVSIYVRARENEKYLTKQTDWLIGRFGAEILADVLLGLAERHSEYDFSFVLSAIPTACLTWYDNEQYTTLLQTILNKITLNNASGSSINANTLAIVAWTKMVSIKMKVNASDAAPIFHSFIDAGYRTYPMTPRARIMLDTVYYRFLALEAFHSMKVIMSPEENGPLCMPLLDELEDSEERLLLSSHLFGSYAAYLRRAFVHDCEEYGMLARRGYELLGSYLIQGELEAVYADDVAMMIDCMTDDSDDMLRVDLKSVSSALRFMAAGQLNVNSALLKYLPRILYAAKYSLDTDADDFSEETVNTLRRLCAVSRAVAGSAMTVDDMLYATVQMEQSYDILCERISPDEHFALISHLDKFVRILLNTEGENPRVLYRCYMPLRKLLTTFEIYEMERASGSLLSMLAQLEVKDGDAPILPELFLGALIYRFGGSENDALRDRLRELAQTVEESDEYSDYASAYSPELMFIGIDLRTPDEIDEDSGLISTDDIGTDGSDEDFDLDEDDEFDLDDDELDLDDDEFGLDEDGEDFDIDTDGDEDADVTEFSEEEINDMLNFLKSSGFSLEDLLGDGDEE